jgi:hypothetical protein
LFAHRIVWVLSGVRTGFSGFFAFVLFLVVLVPGFVVEWQKGALDWTSKGSSTFVLQHSTQSKSSSTFFWQYSNPK